jgi:serine/threonine protein kinase
MKTETAGSQTSKEPSAPGAGLLALGFFTGGAAQAAVSESEQSGDVIGRYELMEPLGEGGFGVVWRARQHEPIQREVALKVIKPGLDSREVICRFEAERQALALMDHPNIAAVFDAGSTADGRPYFVMELVQGTPLAEYCDARKLTIPERLRLFIPVCQAVQHAHQKAVLHRDLKPSNILVAEIDGQPVPKVIDFGVAKALAPAADALPFGRTQAGIVVGTPQYMSPEQAGCGLDVDTRSDVYSLGVILCELLTGRTQLPPETADFTSALRLICDSASVRPSLLVQPVTSAVEQAAAQRRLTTVRFGRALRGDLDWITLKALEKDRCRRYETPLALAIDVQKHLEGKTVSAAAPAWRYQAGKFARRHRGALIAASLAVSALIAGTAVSLWQAANAERSRKDAQTNYDRTRKAVEVYLSKAADHPRLQQEDFKDLQLELFKAALPLYEDMSRVEGDDPSLLSDRAWAMGRMGDVYLSIKDFPKAEEAYRKTMAIDNELVRRFPDNIAYRHTLAMRHNNLSSVQHSSKRAEEAIASQESALTLLESVVKEEPDNAGYRANLATVLMNRGTFLKGQKKLPESEAAYLRSIGLFESLVADHPVNSTSWQNLGTCRVMLGHLLSDTKRENEARERWRSAMDAFVEAEERDSSNHEARTSLCLCLLTCGRSAFSAGDYEEGDALFREARELARRNVDQYPGYSVYRENLMNVLNMIGNSYSQRGRDDEALEMLEELKVEQQRLMAAFPRSTAYPPLLAKTFAKLGDAALKKKDLSAAKDRYEQAFATHRIDTYCAILCGIAIDMGDHATAVRRALESTGLAKPNWQKREWVAQRIGRALPLIAADAKLERAAREELIERCGSKAVEMLKEAVELGYTGIAQFRTPDITIDLRERPDFKALAAKEPAPPQGIASAFCFDYKGGDDPGIRKWRREGLLWTEAEPSGKINRYAIFGLLTVDGINGIEVRRNDGGQQVFIPNPAGKESADLKMLIPGGSWRVIGRVTDMK